MPLIDQQCRCAHLLPIGSLIQGLQVPRHDGNYLMRSMEDSQLKIAIIVYRAGTRDGPSFDSNESINEGTYLLAIYQFAGVAFIPSFSTYQIS